MNHSFNYFTCFFFTLLFSSTNSAVATADMYFFLENNKEKKYCINYPYSQLKICNDAKEKIHGPFLPPKTELNLDNQNKNDSILKNTKIYNTINLPDEKKTDWSLMISILALLASIGIPLYTNWKDRNKSIYDDFWMREVILPRINDLTFQTTQSLQKELDEGVDPDRFQQYFGNRFLKEIGSLRDSFGMLSGIIKKNEFIEQLEKICDELEQRISDNLDKPMHIRKIDGQWFQQEIIKNLVKCHKVA